MSKFDVNFKRFSLLMLPTFWRRPIIAALTYAIITPLSNLQTLFILFRRESNYRLTHNGQVCYLRAVLNDQFDPIDRRITITDDVNKTDTLILFKREVDRPIFLPKRKNDMPILLNRRGFAGTNKIDFWVNVPMALSDEVDNDRLRAIVNTYKLASKRFSLNYK